MKFRVYCNLKLAVLLLLMTFKYGLTKDQDSTIKAFHLTLPNPPTTKSFQAQNLPANNLTTRNSSTTAPQGKTGTAFSSSSISTTSNGQIGTSFSISTESNVLKGRAFSSISTTSKVSQDLTNDLYGSAMVGIPSPVTEPGQMNPNYKNENHRGIWADSENFDESSDDNDLQNPPIYEGSPRDRFNYEEIEGRALKYPEPEEEPRSKLKKHPHGKGNDPNPGFRVDKADNFGDPEASLKPFGKDTSVAKEGTNQEIDPMNGASGLTNYMLGLEWHILICLFILYEVCYEVFKVL